MPDSERLLAFVADAQSVDGNDPFTPELLDRLAAAMECQFATYYEVDLDARAASAYIPCSLEARLAPLPPAEVSGRFDADRGEQASVRLWSDDFGRRERWRFETARWAEAYGVVDGAATSFRSGAFRRSRLVLHRQDRDFTERDRRFLIALRPHIGALIRHAHARRRLADLMAAIDFADDARFGFLLVGNRFAVEHASPAARRILEHWFGGLGQQIPKPLEDWLRSDAQRDSLTVERGGRRLVVDAPTDGALVLTEEVVLPASLTAREVQVLRCLASGKATPEIARILWITPATVSKHLERIYRKLGVTNRTAALAAAGFSPESLDRP